MFFHIGGKSYNVDGEKKKKRRKVSSSSKGNIDADLNADVSVKRDDSFTIPEGDLTTPSVNIGASSEGAADVSGAISGGLSASAKAEVPTVDTNLKSSTEASTKAEVGSDVQVTLPSAEVSLPSVSLGADANANESLKTGVTADASAAVSSSVEASADTSASATGDLGSFNAEVGGKSFEIKMSF